MPSRSEPERTLGQGERKRAEPTRMVEQGKRKRAEPIRKVERDLQNQPRHPFLPLSRIREAPICSKLNSEGWMPSRSPAFTALEAAFLFLVVRNPG